MGRPTGENAAAIDQDGAGAALALAAAVLGAGELEVFAEDVQEGAVGVGGEARGWPLTVKETASCVGGSGMRIAAWGRQERGTAADRGSAGLITQKWALFCQVDGRIVRQ
jgi:hypothetical protein